MSKGNTPRPCPLGKTPYANKQQAQQAADGQSVARCGRCRQWHVKGERR